MIVQEKDLEITEQILTHLNTLHISDNKMQMTFSFYLPALKAIVDTKKNVPINSATQDLRSFCSYVGSWTLPPNRPVPSDIVITFLI